MRPYDEPEQPRTWWTFFPFRGIEITNKRQDIRNPLFGDATLISARHIRSLILSLRLEEDPEFNSQRINDLIQSIEQIAVRESAKTFLAVQRTGVVDFHSYDDMEEPVLVYNARKRAYEISALLAIVLLPQNKYRVACGLSEQIFRRFEYLTLLDMKDGGFWVQTAGQSVISAYSADIDEPMTRADIRRAIFQEPFRVLSDIVITRKSQLSKSLQRTLQQAMNRLADALHSVVLSAQLLGAVTTLEILFTTGEGEKYDAVRQRSIALLGLKLAERYEIKKILQARHLYVHQGRDVDDEDIAYQAVTLAISCLLHYARAVTDFLDKLDFIRYLDFIYTAEQRSEVWNDIERKAFQRLLKHDRTPIKLPFGTFE